MSGLALKSPVGMPVERLICACGHDVDLHSHPSVMVRDSDTGEVSEHFTHGRCNVADCGCSAFVGQEPTRTAPP
jgi:hypothetical protein